ncbi:hypothetical protein C0J50_20399 [Silurus asotus]|uniref:Uncharacterized protein n=1 Tax=Silurus asotus TaxID=30991 RepID=A0AAD5AQT3_SILAS|nr:hypothetical protein C0J50_20399 [Silurus asotus]
MEGKGAGLRANDTKHFKAPALKADEEKPREQQKNRGNADIHERDRGNLGCSSTVPSEALLMAICPISTLLKTDGRYLMLAEEVYVCMCVCVCERERWKSVACRTRPPRARTPSAEHNSIPALTTVKSEKQSRRGTERDSDTCESMSRYERRRGEEKKRKRDTMSGRAVEWVTAVCTAERSGVYSDGIGFTDSNRVSAWLYVITPL